MPTKTERASRTLSALVTFGVALSVNAWFVRDQSCVYVGNAVNVRGGSTDTKWAQELSCL